MHCPSSKLHFTRKSIHAYNYLAIVLMVAPFLLKLGKSSPVALWLSVVTRVTTLLLPALTDHPTGLARVELEGKHAGDAISFNGRELVIEEVA